ncbi:MAG TPA: hypothetical protein PLG47_05340, partial [Candidatus Dojkabacteria bacterium]|nr:hypothetical protein [Candidatus Dojkabacteria bacterium]
QPLCNTTGYGITIPNTIEVYWYFYCNDNDTYEEVVATSTDTIYYTAGNIIVTAKVKVWQMGIGWIYLSPAPSYQVQGNNSECFELLSINTPVPIDTTTNTTINTPLTQATMDVYGGVVEVTNGNGVLFVFDWLNMQILYIKPFNQSITYDLNQHHGIFVRVIAVFQTYSLESDVIYIE